MPDQDQSTGKSTTNWSEDLEEFHEESTRDHPIEVLTRRTVLSRLRLEALSSMATVVEVGCSTGYMLADLRAAFPYAELLGFDLIASGLRKAHATLPECVVAQADACELPLAEGATGSSVSICWSTCPTTSAALPRSVGCFGRVPRRFWLSRRALPYTTTTTVFFIMSGGTVGGSLPTKQWASGSRSRLTYTSAQ